MVHRPAEFKFLVRNEDSQGPAQIYKIRIFRTLKFKKPWSSKFFSLPYNLYTIPVTFDTLKTLKKIHIKMQNIQSINYLLYLKPITYHLLNYLKFHIHMDYWFKICGNTRNKRVGIISFEKRFWQILNKWVKINNYFNLFSRRALSQNFVKPSIVKKNKWRAILCGRAGT